MSSNTPNLDLLKKDPITDDSDTFNIETMLNENWDKIDDAVGLAMTEAAAAKQAGNERKAELVAALVSKGVTATTADSWDVLYSKMASMVTAIGTALQHEVMTGRTFSTPAGNGLVGTATPKVPNLIKNGSFENGLTSWVAQSMSVDVLAGVVNGVPAKVGDKRLTATLLASVTEGHLLQTITYVANHQYYACGYALCGREVTMDLYFPLLPPYSSATGIKIVGNNSWNFFSGIIPAISTVPTQKAQVRFDINNGGVETYAWLDGLMLIDLTESFGAGKEPSKSIMDAIVQGNGGWWDSVLNVIAGVKTGIVIAEGGGQWADGGLAVYPPEGYYKGGPGEGEIKVTPAQLQSFVTGLQARNIRSDATIMGVKGSIPILNGSNGGGTQANYHNPVELTPHDGHSLFVRPYHGAIYEGDTWIQLREPDFHNANIRAGVNMFGLVGTLQTSRFDNLIKQEGAWTNPIANGSSTGTNTPYNSGQLITTIPCSKRPTMVMMVTDLTQYNLQPDRGWKFKQFIPPIVFTLNMDSLLATAGKLVEPINFSSDTLSFTTSNQAIGPQAYGNGIVQMSISADGRSVDVKSGYSSSYAFNLRWIVYYN